jgi:hypothetical protein
MKSKVTASRAQKALDRARKRVSAMSDAERAELDRRAREIIAANTQCKDCCYAYTKRWHEKHSERTKVLQREWKVQNPSYHRKRRCDAAVNAGLPTKTCEACGDTLPITSFYKHTSNFDRLQKKCISCYLKYQTEYRAKNLDWLTERNREWAKRNAENVKKHNAKLRTLKIAKNEAVGKPACPTHGDHDEWKHTLLKTRWYCQKCRKEHRKKSRGKQQRHAGSARHIRFMTQKHGEQLASEYKACLTDSEFSKLGGTERIYEVKRRVFLRDHGLILSIDSSKRIIQLNRLAGQHSLNIGWHCNGCGLFSKEPYMVDIDHILPRCKEGKDEKINLQILCLWCHRKKTLIDLGKTGSFFEAPMFSKFPSPSADTGGRVTMPESCQDGGVAKVMRCEASNSAA